MKELLEKDFNYFQWDGILKGRQMVKNEIIQNCFNQRIPIKRIAFLVNLTPQEVKLRIKEMKLVRPSRMRKAVVLPN